jgi:1,2-dihydroxy-3-keto-5-methylthiopentene dioxygenase
MSYLRVYNDTDANYPVMESADFNSIQSELNKAGVRFERWISREVKCDALSEDILSAFQSDIERLKIETGCTTCDVISLMPTHPQKDEFRSKFLEEHTHSEDEIRFFVRGSGLFYLHIDKKVYIVLCEKNDLISVPDGTPHWFDMGPDPDFTCIRLFSNTEGWVARFTGFSIADQYPKWEQFEVISG